MLLKTWPNIFRFARKIRLFSFGSFFLVTSFLLLISTGAVAESGLPAEFHSRYYENVADQMYLTREIPGNLKLAIDFYKKAIAAQPERPGVHWKVSRCYWVLATKHSVNRKERLAYLKEGIRFSKTAIETDDKNADAFVWHALVHGDNAIVKGVMNTIYMRVQILEWLETAARLDPKNINAILGLAGWYYHVPEIFGGDKQRTFRLIKEAEAIDPTYTAIYIQKAQYLIAEKRFKEAERTLKKILKMKSPKLRNDGVEDKETSRRLLEKLKREGHLI